MVTGPINENVELLVYDDYHIHMLRVWWLVTGSIYESIESPVTWCQLGLQYDLHRATYMKLSCLCYPCCRSHPVTRMPPTRVWCVIFAAPCWAQVVRFASTFRANMASATSCANAARRSRGEVAMQNTLPSAKIPRAAVLWSVPVAGRSGLSGALKGTGITDVMYRFRRRLRGKV